MKKIAAALLTAALMFAPVSNFVFPDHPTTVEAKSYKSGKKGFNFNSSSTTNQSSFQNKADTSTINKSATASSTKGFMSSGLMKGLMVGGIAGLLFGGLFANMGILGSILGLFVNVMAIFLIIGLIRRLFTFFKNKRKKEEANPWRS
ncbi:hypothetical protein SAMN05877753_104302 [Bacillus oleivorans]|uniref:Preprotein translocase subunit Tim44 n=1 Tax=Bacillus oleivorans TaxID=1448271 RepID=A0A285CUX2_9BACI|nr:hypothetical protein [Bacillus oleivorans]SNX70733.1 hypothetical protein SAMN05877753_104302 [Bacillus oleivorans]